MPFAFAGYPPYLERAAQELQIADRGALDEARRQVALTRLSNLIAGAISGPPGAEASILREARRSRDALALALWAADHALADAASAFGLALPEASATPAAKPAKRPKG
jgi:hypothetical protein